MIRSATPADISSLLQLERQCTSAAHWAEEQYRQALQSEGVERLVLVAESFEPRQSDSAAGSLVGFLVALNLAPEWELENIVVAPAARGTRIATRLLDALFTVAAEQKSDAVFLEVRESNAAARALYKKVGFEQTGRRKAYYKDPVEDAVVYRRIL